MWFSCAICSSSDTSAAAVSCWIADSAWLDTEQQQGAFVDMEPGSFYMRHNGHDMLGEPSCTSPRPDAELDRLFVNTADAGSMRAVNQFACRDQQLYGDSTDTILLLEQPTQQQAEFPLEADDILTAEASGMNEYTTSDLSALSEQPEHNDAAHSNDCDLHALFSRRDDACAKQAKSHIFAEACSDPWLDQMVRLSRE